MVVVHILTSPKQFFVFYTGNVQNKRTTAWSFSFFFLDYRERGNPSYNPYNQRPSFRWLFFSSLDKRSPLIPHHHRNHENEKRRMSLFFT